MTRINVGILPSELNSKHLNAEHREIKRIPNLIRNGRYNFKDQPKEFTLGTGHVKFFYDKLLFLKNRYFELHQECLRRGFNSTNFIGAWDGVPSELMNDYVPTERDRQLLLQRIKERNDKIK